MEDLEGFPGQTSRAKIYPARYRDRSKANEVFSGATDDFLPHQVKTCECHV